MRTSSNTITSPSGRLEFSYYGSQRHSVKIYESCGEWTVNERCNYWDVDRKYRDETKAVADFERTVRKIEDNS